MKIIRFICTLLIVLTFASCLAYAQQYHPANEINPGTYPPGNYIFQGNLIFTNQPWDQITVIPSNNLNPQYSAIRIRDSSDTTNVIDLQKGGNIIADDGDIIAKRIGIGIDGDMESPKYSLDIPRGDMSVLNITIPDSSHPNIAFLGGNAYINTKVDGGNIYLGSGIWSGMTSNVNIGANLNVNEMAYFGAINGQTDGIYLRGTDWADASIYFDSFDFRIRDQSRGRNLIERSWNAPQGDFLSISNAQGGGAALDDKINLSDVDGFTVETNGQERMRIKSDGNVGIGQNNPMVKLVVNGSVNIGDSSIQSSQHSLVIGDFGDTSYLDNGMFDISDLSWIMSRKHSMYVLGGIRSDGSINVDTGNLTVRTGNVGIGTNNPIGKLHINFGAPGVNYVRVTNDVNTIAVLGDNTAPNDAGSLFLYYNNVLTTRISVNDSYFNGGRVGIGTTLPTANLDISNPAGYNQLRMRTAYTPSSSADTNGNVGDVAWDANYIYIKTSAGWKRASLTSW